MVFPFTLNQCIEERDFQFQIIGVGIFICMLGKIQWDVWCLPISWIWELDVGELLL